MTAPEGSLVFANGTRAALQRGTAVGVLLLAVATAASAAPERQVQAGCLVAGVAAFIAILRVAAARVEVVESGVVLRRPIRTARITWDDVERFVIRDPARPGDPAQPVAALRDGSDEVLPGLAAPFALLRRNDTTAQAEMIAELNRRLQQHQSGGDH